MTGQLSLPGFGSDSGTLCNFFLALLPSPPAAAAIGRIQQQLLAMVGQPARAIRSGCLHVSLQFLGCATDLPLHVRNAVHTAAQDLALAPFEVTFDRCLNFKSAAGGSHPVVLSGPDARTDIHALRQALSTQLAHHGIACRARASFTPHLTLLYAAAAAPERSVEPIRWLVDEIVLVRSVIGRARYEICGRWPLCG
ncbi:MAG: 2'-5' RNA ligase family protein [Opitutus sp.]|nr:2'-5' RNA ligase family protein [Opitutus sp.]